MHGIVSSGSALCVTVSSHVHVRAIELGQRFYTVQNDVQAIKECNIHLSHLNTSYASAQRLRAALRVDTSAKEALQEQAAELTEQVTLCVTPLDALPSHALDACQGGTLGLR